MRNSQSSNLRLTPYYAEELYEKGKTHPTHERATVYLATEVDAVLGPLKARVAYLELGTVETSSRLTYVEHRLVRAEAELLKSGIRALETDYMRGFPEPYIPGEPIPAVKDPGVPQDRNAAAAAGLPFIHWSKDPLIPYAGCECVSCVGVRVTEKTSADPSNAS